MQLQEILDKYPHIDKTNVMNYIFLSNEDLVSKKETFSQEHQALVDELLKSKIDGLSGVVFDLEATCDDKKINKFFDNETIEIGAVKVLNGIIVDEFNEFIKPRDTIITPYCTNLTTITKEDVLTANNFETVLIKFKIFTGELEVLSWGLYDKKQLIKDINRHKLNQTFVEWLDVKHRNIKGEHGQAFNLKGGRGVGTGRALQMCGHTFNGTKHRGIDDAKNIAKIFISNKDVFMK